jgi:hypothetical protein
LTGNSEANAAEAAILTTRKPVQEDVGLEELRSASFASTPTDEHAAKTKTKQGPEQGRS